MKVQSQSTEIDDPLTTDEEAFFSPQKLDKLSQKFYPLWDLEDRIIHELVSGIEGRLKEENITGARRAFVLADLVRALTPQPPSLPKQAPELYKDRSDRREKPDAFVRRVYRAWLEQPGGLPRPVLRTIDEPCYRALYKHGIPADLAEQMPTAQGRSIEDLTRSDTELLEAVRSSRRQADNRRRKTNELAR